MATGTLNDLEVKALKGFANSVLSRNTIPRLPLEKSISPAERHWLKGAEGYPRQQPAPTVRHLRPFWVFQPSQPLLLNVAHEQVQAKQAKKPPSQLKEPLETINHCYLKKEKEKKLKFSKDR